MGCTSSVPNGPGAVPAAKEGKAKAEGSTPAPTNEQEEFWVLGQVQIGDVNHGVPKKGPFGDGSSPPQPERGQMLFSVDEVPKVPSEHASQLVSNYGLNTSLHARAFFPHPLPCYCAGWARLDVTPEHPHHNCRKQREKEKERKSMGVPIDYSRRRKYFLFPERIPEIGLFVSLDGKPVVTDNAESLTSWKADPIEGAFFTFSPESGGSLFSENTLSIPLRPTIEQLEAGNDKRWAALALHVNKMLAGVKTGNHKVEISVVFRFGNTKFTAWKEGERDKTSYRYTDDDREETKISAKIATGRFEMKVDDSLLKQAQSMTPKYEELLAKMKQSK